MKRILITGAGSFIGTSVEKWLSESRFSRMYQVDVIDMRGMEWKQKNFGVYDSVFHVAGIAHVDVKKVNAQQKAEYFRVNCDLAAAVAKKAKKEGVKQFIYMSSIIVYGEEVSLLKKRIISKDTKPSPSNFYGESKWKAEQRIMPLSAESFQIAILRPPMIYGKGARGNYQVLSELARRILLFPDIENERSMLYIENLCEFVRLLIESGRGGVFFPQNHEYVRTSELVKEIAVHHHKKLYLCPWLNGSVYLLNFFPGRIHRIIGKAFGNLVYEKEISVSPIGEGNYQMVDFCESVRRTEGGRISEGQHYNRVPQ